MITEDYVSFETAKLLKEKGFDEKCFALYNPDGVLIQSGIRLNNIQVGQVKGSYSAPTLQMAMKWLREVHHIIIVPQPLSFNGAKDFLCDNWIYSLWVDYNLEVDEFSKNQTNYPTYEEACEAAIKYCHEHNLI